MIFFDSAIKMEEEARSCYEKLAAAAVTPGLRKLFKLLSESEQEHHVALMKLRECAAPLKIEFNDLQGAVCQFKPKIDLKVEPSEESDAYMNIVNIDLAAQTKDELTRKILLMIANEERKHLSIVKNIYSFVESPRTFLVSAEFSNLNDY